MPKKVCSTPDCDEPVFARGMCTACYSFDRYHTELKHGQWYWMKYEKKHKRLLGRCRARMVRRRRRTA